MGIKEMIRQGLLFEYMLMAMLRDVQKKSENQQNMVVEIIFLSFFYTCVFIYSDTHATIELFSYVQYKLSTHI